jgi:hypothetical protein
MDARPACPQVQRRLELGCSGGDVLALQRALHKAIREGDGEPTCALSGTFDDKTKHDVQTYQQMQHLANTGKVGLNTLHALWVRPKVFPAGAFDAYGVQLMYRERLGHPTKLDKGELEKGAKGPHVKAMQQMLWRALGGDSRNARNGVYGDGTMHDLRRFLDRANWPDKPVDTVGQGTWEALWAFGDELAHKLARKEVVTPDDEVRHSIRSWGEWYVANRSRISYAQVRPYPKTRQLPIRTDCSGSSTHVLLMSGCPNDPHLRDWDGLGYTGTMYQHGTHIGIANASKLLPGDCCFYGDQGGGVPSHVVIVIGPGDRALNFGSNPPHFVSIGSYWRDNLRTDIGARRYF